MKIRTIHQKIIFHIIILCLFLINGSTQVTAQNVGWWEFQSIDTMKYSRDMSAQYLHNRDLLAKDSEEQVKAIAETGATHVAIATPYDEEFLPVLQAWVLAARKNNLKVWFRGNWSGWEEWFEYPPLSREEHITKTVEFIKLNTSLFENGDYFSACPECENGGPGDPRHNGDKEGHVQFLIEEHQAMSEAFRLINKNVQVNLHSMNGDVAELLMDKSTTQALGGYVVIDHYVLKPGRLDEDITEYARVSGGKVILGEFGVPIPNIHGDMTEREQAEWIDESLLLLLDNPNLVGINYWTNMGGSTALWSDSGEIKQSAAILKKYFSPPFVTGTVTDGLGKAVPFAHVKSEHKSLTTDINGIYAIPYLSDQEKVTFEAEGYKPRSVMIYHLELNSDIKLIPVEPSQWYSFKLWLKSILN